MNASMYGWNRTRTASQLEQLVLTAQPPDAPAVVARSVSNESSSIHTTRANPTPIATASMGGDSHAGDQLLAVMAAAIVSSSHTTECAPDAAGATGALGAATHGWPST